MPSGSSSKLEVMPMETPGQGEGFRWYSEPCVGGLICEAPPPALRKPRLLDKR